MELGKQKDFLICMDSDGCAMDTMNVKHIKCFGPSMVETWKLFWCRDEVLNRWNDINLYSMTRGINRFKALAIMLREIHDTFMEIEDVEALEAWVRDSGELSERSLEHTVKEKKSVCLEKALSWSRQVNERISRLSFDEKPPFEGVKEALVYIHRRADIVVVSSANRRAVEEEWRHFGLLAHTDLVLAQDMGSKAHCISRLLKKGYEKNHVLMIGDAPGDWKAAEKNGIFYYPVLAGHETKSWKEFCETAAGRFFSGSFKGEYQEEKIHGFLDNLR